MIDDLSHQPRAFRVCLATIHANPAFLPLALMYLKAALVDRLNLAPATVPVVELDACLDVEAMASLLEAEEAAVVGLSCYVWNINALHELGRILKTRRPHVQIVLGGPEVGPIALAVMQAHDYIDAVVCSEGELPFVEVVRAIREGRALDDVAGLCIRLDGVPVLTQPAEIVGDLNSLPSPHTAEMAPWVGRSATIETQRGCVFQCNFCFYNKDFSIRNRRFDLDRVKREVRFWLDRDVAELYFMDPVFNLNARRAKEICRFLIHENTRQVPIHAEIWAEFVDDELASLMRAAGFRYLEVGLQTTSAAVLETVDRRWRQNEFLRGLDALARHNLGFELQLIYGLPGETPTSFRAALDYAGRLNPPRLSIFMLMVLPGTELWQKAPSLGITFQASPPYYVTGHSSMSADEIDTGYLLIAAWRQLKRSAAVRLMAAWPGLGLSAVLDAWIQFTRENGAPAGLGPFLQMMADRYALPDALIAPLIACDGRAVEFARPPFGTAADLQAHQA